MIQNLIDYGVREYQLTAHGAPLVFNPGDPNVYARFLESREKITAVEKEMTAKANVISAQKGTSEFGEENLRIMRETDRRIKNILNEVFGHGNDFDKILEGVNLMAVANNKERVVTNLLNALMPIMEEGAKECADDEIGKAKLNREQRRALQ